MTGEFEDWRLMNRYTRALEIVLTDIRSLKDNGAYQKMTSDVLDRQMDTLIRTLTDEIAQMTVIKGELLKKLSE